MVVNAINSPTPAAVTRYFILQLTVTVILEGLLLRPKLSVTVSLKARAVDTVGAINVGVAVVAPVKLTKVPDV